MITTIISVVGVVIALCGTGTGQSYLAKYQNYITRARSFSRIKSFELIRPGTVVAIERPDQGGGGDWLKEPNGEYKWAILTMAPSKIVLKNVKSGVFTQMTPMEFEAAAVFVLPE